MIQIRTAKRSLESICTSRSLNDEACCDAGGEDWELDVFQIGLRQPNVIVCGGCQQPFRIIVI